MASRVLSIRRAALLSATVLAGASAVTAPLFAPDPAYAVDGTWTGPGAEWTTGTNWSSTPTVPDNTATFTNNAAPTTVTISANANINTIQFTAAAPAYTFNVGAAGVVNVFGPGIVNNSASTQTFNNSGLLGFFAVGGSTAGNAVITNNGTQLLFATTSTAGTATITNNTHLDFEVSSTAGNATITNNSTAQFLDSSTAGAATIITSGAGQTFFRQNSTGGNAQFITDGTVDFSGTLGPAGDHKVTAGSIAGAGTYSLGSNQLTVGSNNASTTVSGAIQDGGTFGGTGASLVKVGNGTLTLAGSNTYTGATVVNSGTLIAASNDALPIQSAVSVSAGATLRIGNNVSASIASLADSVGGGSVVLGPVGVGTLLAVVGPGTTTFSGSFSGAGSLELDNAASLTLTGASNGGNIGTIGGDLTLCNCSSGGLTISGGALTVNGSSQGVTVFGGTLTVMNGGRLTDGLDLLVAGNMVVTGAGSSATVAGATGIGIFGPGSLTISNGGVLNSNSGAEIDALFGRPTATVTGAGSAWNLGGFGLTVGGGSTGGPATLTIADGASVNVTAGGMAIGDQADGSTLVRVTGAGSTLNVANALVIGGPGCGCGPIFGALTIADGGVVNSTGTTSIGAGSTLNLGIGGLAGTIVTPAVVNDGRIVANFTDTSTLAASISGAGTLSKAGTGTLFLTGTSTYTGATTVNGGTLAVNGSIAASAVTVNSGGTLAGTGTVGATTVMSGGTLAPGNSPGTITVAGSLAFQSGAVYLVQVSPSAASLANVSGTATLGGARVNAQFAPGSYVTRQYTILHSGGLAGTFSGVTSSNPNFAVSLGYTATDVILNLAGALGAGAGLSGNQQNVANAINSAFNSGGTLPPGFVSLFGLTGGNLGNALSQLSGEAATGAQQGAFQLMGQFLGTMLDPFVDGRAGFGSTGPALGFAAERAALPDDVALAYAKVMKAPHYNVQAAPTFEQRWTVWGSAYGGYNKTNGDAAVGSHDFNARAGGIAAGADYRLTRDTVVGFALAGGGTNWSLANGLGGGSSDVFQAGVYGATRWGPAYLAGSLAYAHHWMTTDRFAAFNDHLTAKFGAESFGGRVEGGYRFAMWHGGGVTPYAAVQAQGFRTPSYNETDVTGGGFALSYNSRTASDTRSELGARFDHVAAVNATSVLTLRGRLAWAHDWASDPALAAAFQALPGASFIVNGAAPAKDSALVTAGAELRFANSIALLAKFDGEFASGSQTYAGTGTVRYTW